jgi:hypothetical protein
MTVCKEAIVFRNNRLVKSWRCRCHGIKIMRKRLPNKINPFIREVQKIYKEEGPAKAVKYIMDKKDLKLVDAHKMFNGFRGVDPSNKETYFKEWM